MKNPLMFKPMASPNKAQGLTSGPRPFGLGVANPLSAEGEGQRQLANMEASGLPWMQSVAGPVPVPLGAGSPPRGGGGGGSFRMGPRPPRQPIMRLGPRTAGDYYAENPGLAAPAAPTMPAAPASVPSAVPGGDPNAAPDGFLANQDQTWNDQTGFESKPAMMAKGGTMPNNKPILVGEEGRELIMKRDDGTGFVLPNDVTEQILPMMMDKPTARKNGGKMDYRAEGGPVPYEVLQTPSNAFRAVAGPYGQGFAAARGPAMMEAAGLTDTFMADPTGQYQLDRRAPGLPILPDMEGLGDFTAPGLPVTPEMRSNLQTQLTGRVNALRQTGDTPEAFQMVTDQATGEQVSQRDMLGRVALRGQELAGELGARREAADRARLAALPPIGTRPPGIDPVQRRLDRNMERFMRTPQGMMFALEQGQQGRLMSQRAQLAATAIPVTDPATGQVIGYTNGLGASLPNPTQGVPKTLHSQREVNGVLMNFYRDGTSEPAAPSGAAPMANVLAWDGSKVVELPPNTNTRALPAGLVLLPTVGAAEIGGADTETTNTNAPSSQTPATATPAGTAAPARPGAASAKNFLNRFNKRDA